MRVQTLILPSPPEQEKVDFALIIDGVGRDQELLQHLAGMREEMAALVGAVSCLIFVEEVDLP